jgi:hypothetical protein
MNSPAGINNEEKLLLNLCRLGFDDRMASAVREIASSVQDWKKFADLANEHGVVAMVYNNLERLDLIKQIPSEIIEGLHNKYMISLSRNAFHSSVIAELQKLFIENGIRLVLLKGMALEYSVYGNAGLRQMSDIDILIDRKDHGKARQIMINNGYDQLPVKSVFHKPIIEYLGKHLPSFVRNGVSLDIHLELFPGTKNTLTRELFNSCPAIVINGENIDIPGPKYFFVYLVSHLWNHELTEESQLRLYADLVLLIERYHDEIFSEGLIDIAARAGLKEVLWEKLRILEKYWKLSIPEQVLNLLKNESEINGESKFIEFLKKPKNSSAKNNRKLYKKTLSEVPGIHRRILYLVGDIIPTLSFMKDRYGCKTNFTALLYYPHRFGKIIWLLFG